MIFRFERSCTVEGPHARSYLQGRGREFLQLGENASMCLELRVQREVIRLRKSIREAN